MPAFANLSEAEAATLIQFLRTLKPRGRHGAGARDRDARRWRAHFGLVLNKSQFDMQLLGDDRKLHLLRASGPGNPDDVAAVTSQTDWTSYNGGYDRQPLQHAVTDQQEQRRDRWRRSGCSACATANNLQVTPVVSDGVMYVTSANECYALDAGSGPRDLALPAAADEGSRRQRRRRRQSRRGRRRRSAVHGDRPRAPHRARTDITGALLWETEMADWHQNYNATGAPLPVGNLVVTGTSGGDEGVRGFVAAFDQSTGKEVWRFWTMPKPRRARIGNVAGQRARSSGRHDLDDGRLRSAARYGLLAVGNPGPDLHRRRSARRQPLHRFRRRARREDRAR